MKTLVAVPIFNEAKYIDNVVQAIMPYADELLLIDDGSTDATPLRIAELSGVYGIRHATNRGYGAALRSAFQFAIAEEYDALITIDCDGQHQPRFIPEFIRELADCDIVSGSRYLSSFKEDAQAPETRLAINRQITAELNAEFDLALTDAFCGFKAYRVSALKQLRITQEGYAMPLELWVQAVHFGLRIKELAVPRIYLDMTRTFGASLNDAEVRLAHYRDVIQSAQRQLTCAPTLNSQAIDVSHCECS